MSEARSSSLFGSLRNLATTVVAIAQTRLEILSTEIEEEKLRFLQLLMLGAISLFCFGMGVILLTFFIVFFFWETHPLLALGSFTAIFLIAGIIIALVVRNKMRVTPKIFSTSVTELLKDREHLTTDE